MLFALSLAAVVAAASPSPAPSGPPEIAHVKAMPACSALRQLSFPMAAIAEHDDAAFRGIDVDMVKFVGGFSALDAPTGQELEAALAPPQGAPGSTPAPGESEASNPGEEVQQQIDSPGDHSSGTPMESQVQDDDVTFNGKSLLAAANVQTIVAQIFQNLTLADSLMQQSWKEYPAGVDPAYDALRQRVQNLIDLQRALANKYAFFTGSYLDNSGYASLAATVEGQYAQTDDYKTLLRAIAMGESAALVAAARSPGNPSQWALNDVSQLKKSDNVAAIIDELRNQERAFLQEVSAQFNECTGH